MQTRVRKGCCHRCRAFVTRSVMCPGEEVDALLAKGQAGAHILAALGGDRTAKQPPTNLAALRATAEVPTRMHAVVAHA